MDLTDQAAQKWLYCNYPCIYSLRAFDPTFLTILTYTNFSQSQVHAAGCQLGYQHQKNLCPGKKKHISQDLKSSSELSAYSAVFHFCLQAEYGEDVLHIKSAIATYFCLSALTHRSITSPSYTAWGAVGFVTWQRPRLLIQQQERPPQSVTLMLRKALKQYSGLELLFRKGYKLQQILKGFYLINLHYQIMLCKQR